MICRNQFYWFDVLDADGLVAVTAADIAANLERILRDAARPTDAEAAAGAVPVKILQNTFSDRTRCIAQLRPGSSFLLSAPRFLDRGVLTTENRRTWAALRAELAAHDPDGTRSNAASLEKVDSALFLLCLDDVPSHDDGSASANGANGATGANDTGGEPAKLGAAAVAANMLHGSYKLREGVQVGTCCNRWYDKLQLVVCRDGAAGVNFEHSATDGHTMLRFVSDVFTDTIIRFAQTITTNVRSVFEGLGVELVARHAQSKCRAAERRRLRAALGPAARDRARARKLEWRLTPSLRRAVRFAETKISDLIVQNETRVLEFSDFGKRFIVGHNLSPDAFVQLSMVIAYVKYIQDTAGCMTGLH